MAKPARGAGAGRLWRAVAWTTLVLNVVVAAVFAVPAALILSVGRSAAGKTETPEQYGAAMIFAMLGGVSALFALLALALAIAVGVVRVPAAPPAPPAPSGPWHLCLLCSGRPGSAGPAGLRRLLPLTPQCAFRH